MGGRRQKGGGRRGSITTAVLLFDLLYYILYPPTPGVRIEGCIILQFSYQFMCYIFMCVLVISWLSRITHRHMLVPTYKCYIYTYMLSDRYTRSHNHSHSHTHMHMHMHNMHVHLGIPFTQEHPTKHEYAPKGAYQLSSQFTYASFHMALMIHAHAGASSCRCMNILLFD